MPLQRLVGNIYSVFMEILLWLMPIAGIIAGFYSASEMYLFDGNVLIGIFLGILAGLLVDIILFGPIIMLINMRSSLKKMENR